MNYYNIIIEYANIILQDERRVTIRISCDGFDKALNIASKEVKKLYANNKHEVYDVVVQFDYGT